LLPVKFEVESQEIQGEVDITRLHLPRDLAVRLDAAATAFLVSDLKEACGEVERLGPAYARLAQQMRDYISRYDMNGLVAFLAALPRQGAEAI
jgi:hypothetical protein